MSVWVWFRSHFRSCWIHSQFFHSKWIIDFHSISFVRFLQTIFFCLYADLKLKQREKRRVTSKSDCIGVDGNMNSVNIWCLMYGHYVGLNSYFKLTCDNFCFQSLGYPRASLTLVNTDYGFRPQLKYLGGSICSQDPHTRMSSQIDFYCDPSAGKVVS